MKKKKKRPANHNILRFALIASILILILLSSFVTLFLRTSDPLSDYSTQPWEIAFMACTTQRVYPTMEQNNLILLNALIEQNIMVEQLHITTSTLAPACYSSDGTAENQSVWIDISIDSDERTLSDTQLIGQAIYDVIEALDNTDIRPEIGGLDRLAIRLYVNNNQQFFWYMGYAEAHRAYEAGLTGVELYEIGL